MSNTKLVIDHNADTVTFKLCEVVVTQDSDGNDVKENKVLDSHEVEVVSFPDAYDVGDSTVSLKAYGLQKVCSERASDAAKLSENGVPGDTPAEVRFNHIKDTVLPMLTMVEAGGEGIWRKVAEGGSARGPQVDPVFAQAVCRVKGYDETPANINAFIAKLKEVSKEARADLKALEEVKEAIAAIKAENAAAEEITL